MITGGHDTDEERQQQHNGTQADSRLVGGVAEIELAVRELVEVSTLPSAGLPMRVQLGWVARVSSSL